MARLLSLLLVAMFAAPSLGAASIFDRLYREDAATAVPVTLILPTDSLMARSPRAQPGSLSFLGADGHAQNWSVKVTTRGKFRRNRCEMPPPQTRF